jgi:predicted permease
MTIAIVILNTVLRIVNIFLVKKIGFNKESEVTMTIMTFVFYSQFLNTGLILLLTNANFDNTPLSWLPIKNQFSDFTQNWYDMVGDEIVKTMMI